MTEVRDDHGLSGPEGQANGSGVGPQFDVCRVCVILILGIEVAGTAGLV